MHAAQGIVFMRHGPAKIHQQPVAEILCDVAFVLVNHLGGGRLVGAHDLPQVFGVELLGDLVESARSQNITVNCRRSASGAWRATAGEQLRHVVSQAGLRCRPRGGWPHRPEAGGGPGGARGASDGAGGDERPTSDRAGGRAGAGGGRRPLTGPPSRRDPGHLPRGRAGRSAVRPDGCRHASSTAKR